MLGIHVSSSMLFDYTSNIDSILEINLKNAKKFEHCFDHVKRSRPANENGVLKDKSNEKMSFLYTAIVRHIRNSM